MTLKSNKKTQKQNETNIENTTKASQNIRLNTKRSRSQFNQSHPKKMNEWIINNLKKRKLKKELNNYNIKRVQS